MIKKLAAFWTQLFLYFWFILSTNHKKKKEIYLHFVNYVSKIDFRHMHLTMIEKNKTMKSVSDVTVTIHNEKSP